MKRNSFGHWEIEPNNRNTGCLVCHKYGYENMIKDCKRPRFLVVHSEREFECVTQEGYELLKYEVVSYLKKLDKTDDGPVSGFKEFYLLELPTPTPTKDK